MPSRKCKVANVKPFNRSHRCRDTVVFIVFIRDGSGCNGIDVDDAEDDDDGGGGGGAVGGRA